MRIGYARVSTDAQDYAAQVDALKAAGCEKIVSEKISGAALDRRALVRLIGTLGPGGHLGRNALGQAR
jgi:DNA invertase Pin-like site-specific DNA recombinase